LFFDELLHGGGHLEGAGNIEAWSLGLGEDQSFMVARLSKFFHLVISRIKFARGRFERY
jgi:hypothetical protein